MGDNGSLILGARSTASQLTFIELACAKIIMDYDRTLFSEVLVKLLPIIEESGYKRNKMNRVISESHIYSCIRRLEKANLIQIVYGKPNLYIFNKEAKDLFQQYYLLELKLIELEGKKTIDKSGGIENGLH